MNTRFSVQESDGEYNFYMYLEKNKLIGEARVTYDEDNDSVAILSGLEVNEEYHGMSYGKKFLNYIQKVLRKKDIQIIYLSPATEEAESFWKHMGFEWDESETDAMSIEL